LFTNIIYFLNSNAGTAYTFGAPGFIPDFSGVRGARTLVFCALCCRIVVCPLSVGHVIECPCSIYGFWLPLWYLPTFLRQK